MQFTRRHTLKFAGISCAATALAGALRAEGDPPAASAGTALPFALTTPMHVSQAALRVRDLDPMIDYYRSVLGLNEVARNVGSERLERRHVEGEEPGSGLFSSTVAECYEAWQKARKRLAGARRGDE